MNKLKWNEDINIKLKNKFFDNKGIVDYGSHCIFIEIEKGIAAKLYFSKNNRDYSYENQKKAEKKGVAPAVGDCFPFRYICILDNEKDGLDGAWRRPLYGYLTQIAKPIKKKPSEEELDILFETLKNIGLSNDDCGNHNLGRVDGKLVMIDFDKESHESRV